MNALIPLALTLMTAFPAWAQAVARSPFDPALLWTYAWVIGISALGGLAAFYRKVREGKARAFNVVELVGEFVVSAFAGVVTYWFCQAGAVNEWLTAAFIGIAGHMGSRAIFIFEQALERWYVKAFPPH